MHRLAPVFLILILFVLPAYAQRATGEIVRAEYGSGNQFVDVTARVRSLSADTPRFRVDDDTLGVYSQAPGAKSLRVQVRDTYGNAKQLVFREHEYANLTGYAGTAGGYDSRPRAGYGQADFQITSARYGRGYRTVDVTDALNSRIQNGRLEMRLDGNSLGDDPAPGRSKTLTVHYTYNGHPAQAIFRDGDNVRLPEAYDGSAGESSYNNTGVTITRAQYGAWNRAQDVTSRLNSQIRNGELHLQVTNAAMGGDPAPGQAKTLTVDYLVNGERRQSVAREGETLNIPEGTSSSAYPGASSSQTVVCESTGVARQYCAVDTRGQVRLARQIGSAACRQGSTWGYDDRGIWVSNGCRAEFQVSSSYASQNTGATITLPAGTQLPVRTNEDIDSAQASAGQGFSAIITDDVHDSSGAVAIPKGSDARLVIRSTEGSNLVLDLDSVSVGGRQYSVSTSDLEKKGGSGIGANKKTATMVGGGALAGAIIGAIAGGGKGAAIGAAVGAAGGAGVQVLTKGKQVKVPAETLLTFQLDSDLHLEANQY